MNRKDLEVFVTRLRREFSAAYEAERTAAAHAVILMRRLELTEALLETFADATAARCDKPGDEIPEDVTADPAPPAAVEPRPLDLAGGPTKDAGPGSATVIDYDLVAAVVREATAERRPVSVALIEAFGITRTHATTLIDRCKSRGLLPRDLRTLYSAPNAKPTDRSSGSALSNTIPDSPVPSPTDSGALVEDRNLHGTPPEGDDPSCSAGSTATPGRAASAGERPTPTNTSTSMEWDLPARRRPREEAPDMPRRVTPRHGGNGLAIA